jgi:hypothetical protein
VRSFKQRIKVNFIARYWIQKNQSYIDQLENCVLNFEIHTNGYYRQWRYLYGEKAADGEAYTLSKAEIEAAIKVVSNASIYMNLRQFSIGHQRCATTISDMTGITGITVKRSCTLAT